MKMLSWRAWVQRPSNLIKWREAQALLLRESREVGVEGNIDNQSQIVIA
jgi:hypothetical protein